MALKRLPIKHSKHYSVQVRRHSVCRRSIQNQRTMTDYPKVQRKSFIAQRLAFSELWQVACARKPDGQHICYIPVFVTVVIAVSSISHQIRSSHPSWWRTMSCRRYYPICTEF